MHPTLRTAAAAVATAAIAGTLTGCIAMSPSAEDAADGSLVWSVNTTADRLEKLAWEKPPGKVSPEDITGSLVGQFIALTPQDQDDLIATEGGQSRTVYAMVSDRNRTEVSAFFLAGGTNGLGGLMATHAQRYGCATIRYDYVTRAIDITDDTCPAWIQGDRDSSELSVITEVIPSHPEATPDR